MQKHSIAEIAGAIGAEFAGNGDLLITGAREPQAAGAGHLAVAMSPRYAQALGQGKARAAILWQGADWRGLGLEAAIFVARPRLAMAALTGHLAQTPADRPGIHPSAVISQTASLGKGVAIGPHAVIGAHVEIGEGSTIGSLCTIADGARIGPDAVLAPGVHIGPRVRIGARLFCHSGAVIGADGFSFVSEEKSALEEVRETLEDAREAEAAPSWLKIHSLGGVDIGNDVEVGANSSVDAGTIRPTQIGDGTKIDALVQVGHNVRVGRHCLLCAHVAVGGSAVLGNGVVLGGQAGVADNITIGDGVVAGGASKILSNVPPGRAILGYPAVKIKTHVESYKALRRLPRLLAELRQMKKPVSHPPDSD